MSRVWLFSYCGIAEVLDVFSLWLAHACPSQSCLCVLKCLLLRRFSSYFLLLIDFGVISEKLLPGPGYEDLLFSVKSFMVLFSVFRSLNLG